MVRKSRQQQLREAQQRFRQDASSVSKNRQSARNGMARIRCNPISQEINRERAKNGMRKIREIPAKRKLNNEKAKSGMKKLRTQRNSEPDQSKNYTWPPDITSELKATCIREFIEATSNEALETKKLCNMRCSK